MPPLIVVLGPTGSGKTDLALSLAQIFDGEIVGCDSVQIYRHFNLGTAKTPLAERRGVPHHLIDVVDPDQSFTAGDYARAARSALADISARGRVPVVVGGTGFYLRALLEGLFPAPERDEALRKRLEERKSGVLHRFLRTLDPLTARKMHQNDKKKVIRAIEVSILGQRPMSEQLQAGRDQLTGYQIIRIGLAPPRAELIERLDQRLAAMFEGGLLEEARQILEMGFPRSVRPFESLGYKEALAVIEGRLPLQKALENAQLATRQYAKRQMTWFRREPEVVWMEGFGEDPEVKAKSLDLIRKSTTS